MILSSFRFFSTDIKQAKSVRRCFSRCELPLKPLSVVPMILENVSPSLKTWLRHREEGFVYSYKFLLQSIQEQDLPSLMKICDNKLYEKFQSSFESLKVQNKKMKILNESSELKLGFFNEEFEVQLPELLMKSSLFMKLYKWLLDPSDFVPKKNIKIVGDNDYETIKLSVDVLIQSPMKIRIDERQDNDGKEETHLIRFQIQKKYYEREIYRSGIDSLMFLKDGKAFNNCEWTIQDIDKSLHD